MTEPQQTAQAQDLLPCPFCGGKADFKHHKADHDSNEGYSIRCSNVYCRMAGAACDEEEKDKMIKSWNTRAEREQVRDATIYNSADYAEVVRLNEKYACNNAQSSTVPHTPVADHNKTFQYTAQELWDALNNAYNARADNAFDTAVKDIRALHEQQEAEIARLMHALAIIKAATYRRKKRD